MIIEHQRRLHELTPHGRCYLPDLFVRARDVALVAFFALVFGEADLVADAVAKCSLTLAAI